MKNSMTDLNNHLFAQMERLSDENLSTEQLEHEITRSKGITSVAKQLAYNASLELKAQELKAEYSVPGNKTPTLLGKPAGE
ncbi:putative phage protein [uncultured Thiomicrorhabdus sp.]